MKPELELTLDEARQAFERAAKKARAATAPGMKTTRERLARKVRAAFAFGPVYVEDVKALKRQWPLET